MAVDLFVYGTLMIPEVYRRVSGQPLRDHQRATLHDHQRYRVADQPFPAAVPERGASISGLLVRGLGQTTIERIDHFEGASYQRLATTVETADGPRAAQFYLLRESARQLLGSPPEPWSLERFRSQALASML